MLKKLLLVGATGLFFIYAVFLLVSNKELANTIYVHPGSSFTQLFDDHGNGFLNLPVMLKKYGFNIKQTRNLKNLKNVKKMVFFDIKRKNRRFFNKYPSVVFLWEPPSVIRQNGYEKYLQQFSKIYTWRDDLVDNKKFFKFYLPYPDFSMLENNKPFQEKKLCTLIAIPHKSSHERELYSKRVKLIEFFEKNAPQDFDLIGFGWDKHNYKTYIGPTPNKNCLTNYKFSFCFENCDMEGYVSEKIFDSLRAGCVPIYWGAKNIAQYIPENCFINRNNFSSNAELYCFLKNMSEETHREYVENITAFMKSDKTAPFSIDTFHKIFKEATDIHE